MIPTQNKKSPLAAWRQDKGDQQGDFWQSIISYPCVQGAYWIAPFFYNLSRLRG